MCQVSVTCCCSGRSSGGSLGLVAAGVLVLVAGPVLVAALQAAVDLVTAVVIGLVVAAAVLAVGWVVKGVAEKLIEEWSLRRHNERMARIYPHLQVELQSARRPSIAGPVLRPRVVEAPRPTLPPVRIYPTPRMELGAVTAPARLPGGDA